jgi:hypothetical protein
MATTNEPLRAAKVWKGLPEAIRLEAAAAFWEDAQAVAEQAEVVGLIARRINFRPRSVMALPAERKARLLARMGLLSESVAARLLVAYHLGRQRPMMKAFLDALGIPHDDGVIADTIAPPSAEALSAASRSLAAAFPVEAVRLYFSTLLVQDPETWGALRDVLAQLAVDGPDVERPAGAAG